MIHSGNFARITASIRSQSPSFILKRNHSATSIRSGATRFPSNVNRPNRIKDPENVIKNSFPQQKFPNRVILAAGVQELGRKFTWLPSQRILWGLLQLGVGGWLFIHYVGTARPVSGPSMLPGIPTDGGWAIVSWLHSHGRGLKQGDLVSFEHPVNRGQRSIKRIIAREGDYVLRDTPGGLNGELEDVEGWGWDQHEDGCADKRDQMMVRVPRGHCWVTGDNLSWSRDSRMYGPLPLALIKGKVFWIKEPGWFWQGWKYVG